MAQSCTGSVSSRNGSSLSRSLAEGEVKNVTRGLRRISSGFSLELRIIFSSDLVPPTLRVKAEPKTIASPPRTQQAPGAERVDEVQVAAVLPTCGLSFRQDGARLIIGVLPTGR